MFRFLTSKKGFTLVELMIILVLLSLGFFALANMFRATIRSFDKTEARYRKQESVKMVAELLQKGTTCVTASDTADIFNDISVVPTGNKVDKSYSYLFAEDHYVCSKCNKTWNETSNNCPDSCEGAQKKKDGYFICVLDKGKPRASARRLSEESMYISIIPLKDEHNQISCGVKVSIVAVEDEFNANDKALCFKDYDENTNPNPVSIIDDYIFYELSVAYHFPNMVEDGGNVRVNMGADGEKAHASSYNADGTSSGSSVIASDSGGIVLRVHADSIISGDTMENEVSAPSLCFIATASYGHDSGEVGLLCEFRDKCLLTNPLGTAFVKAYYKLSPPVADFIAEREPLKATVRLALKPLILVAVNALDEDVAQQSLPWFIAFMCCGAGATAMLIKITKKKKRQKSE
ncbi:MAG: PilW family protein [Acutalibacteraceae bacterium]